MKEIKLNGGMVTLVDDEDFDLVNSYHWRAYPHGRGFRVCRANCHTRNGEWNAKNAMLHRFILKAEKGQEIDHIDGNPLNNCRSNLRFCSRLENCRNKPLRKDSTSGFIGVSKNQHGSWRARISINKKRYLLGDFSDKKEAALAYNVAASFAFREFSRMNKL